MPLLSRLALLVAVSGITAPAWAQELSTASDVRVNQVVSLMDLRVTPIAVLQDSRCVSDGIVTCFAGGRVLVRLLVERGGKVGWLDVYSGGLKRWQDLAVAVTVTHPTKPNSGRHFMLDGKDYRFSIRRLEADVQVLE